jgi:hypothetical protein
MNERIRLPRWLFVLAPRSEPEFPEDLTQLAQDELATLLTELNAEFDSIYDNEQGVDAEGLARLGVLTEQIEALSAEATRRDDEASAVQNEADALAVRVRGQAEDGEEDDGDAEAETDGEEGDAVAADPAVPDENAEEQDEDENAEPQSVAASGRVAAQPRRRRRLNPNLGRIAAHAPTPSAGSEHLSIVAAGDVAGFATGQRIEDQQRLALAMHNRARVLSDHSGYVPVASIERDFPITLGEDASPEQIWDIMRRAADPESLVAAGGWCAPSLPIYDFFNIACADGMLDVPTIGITRGGIRFPVSPTIADVLANIWLWTEQNDIDAVTGTGTKPCARIPCPTFTEVRLDCHGLCITAGNLTDRAFPEILVNFSGLTMDAHQHVMNQRSIAAIVAGSTSVTGAGTTNGVAAPLLNNLELQAIDYREKFRMCDDSVLEVVLPRWADGAVRADLARRQGLAPDEAFRVSDAQMAAWFDARDVRVQFVADWQVGSGDLPGQTTPRTGWPANLQFMIMAAGTWVRGNGPTIDLGVVRDSVLNAKNDFTAAWTEECFLMAKIGHESRLVTVPICPDGSSGIQTTHSCPTA